LNKRLEYYAIRAALATIAVTPLFVARWYVGLLDRFIPKWRHIALVNLRLSGMPLGCADKVFDSLARLAHVFARLPRINRENVRRWIRYEGLEHFQEAKRRGKGVLFATGHLGCWELSHYAHALMTEPMSVVVRPLDNPYLDKFVERRRSGSGNKILGKKDLLRDVLKALRANEAVGILVDQNTSPDEGVFVDFFRVPASSNSGFVKLAHKTGAAVIPGFAVWREAERKFVLKFYPILEMTGDLIADTQAVQRAVERAVREYPDQWLWIHRRWKTRPPGGDPIY
jgi:Kdo2-lipid IVA lauroyltransferase/acyltransferase